MRTTGKDTGAVGLTWLTKLAAVVAVVGVFGFDAATVIAGHVSAENDAQAAATAASQAWQVNHDVRGAYQAAVVAVAGHHETVLTCATCFVIDPDNTVHVMVRRTVHTLVLHRIGPLRKYTVETVHGDANYDPP